MEITCPKCGHFQPTAMECGRCGLIFSRYRPEPPPLPAPPRPRLGAFRVLRWMVLVATLCVLGLALRKSEPPQVQADAQAGQRVKKKLKESRAALRSRRPYTLRLNEAEVNSWLLENLALAGSSQQRLEQVEEMIGRQASAEEVQSAVEDLRMQVLGDEVHAYLVFNFHGKDLSLSVSGHLRAEDGYVRLDPTGGKLGSLPIPLPALRNAVAQLFSSAENREKFRLPDYVRDLGVKNGEIVVAYR